MKHFVRDTIIFLIDVLGISSVYRYVERKKGPLVRVLCFHDVPNKKWFEEIVEMLYREYNIITPDQFHNKEFDGKKINILLTFDDGYQSWIDNCMPILNAWSAKGLFFISSGLLDIADDPEKVAVFMRDRLRITPKKALTWKGAREIAAWGQTIGGHTATHANLALLSQYEVHSEISSDKHRLESELGVVIADFAYPFGTSEHITHQAIGEVKNAGYKHHYSAIVGYSPVGVQMYPRTLLEKDQSLSSVQKWIEGGYDIFKRLG